MYRRKNRLPPPSGNNELILVLFLGIIIYLFSYNNSSVIIDTNVSIEVHGLNRQQKLLENTLKFRCYDKHKKIQTGYNLTIPKSYENRYILTIHNITNQSIQQGLGVSQLDMDSNDCLWKEIFKYPKNQEIKLSVPINEPGIYKIDYN